jgi:hypothetical protein
MSHSIPSRRMDRKLYQTAVAKCRLSLTGTGRDQNVGILVINRRDHDLQT